MGAKAVNAAAASINGSVLVRQAPDPPPIFWTPPSPLSKSVARDKCPFGGPIPQAFAIGPI